MNGARLQRDVNGSHIKLHRFDLDCCCCVVVVVVVVVVTSGFGAAASAAEASITAVDVALTPPSLSVANASFRVNVKFDEKKASTAARFTHGES